MNVPLRPLAFILSLLSTSSSFAVDVSHKGNGRYQAVSNSAGGVWIVDSQTGDAKLCFKRNVYEAAPEVNCIQEKSETKEGSVTFSISKAQLDSMTPAQKKIFESLM